MDGDSMSNLALLFPGQGSQELGMGRDIAESSSEAMQLWKKAERISNLPLREIYWDGDDTAMADTRALQPALTVVNLNLWQTLAGRCTPMATAGHSLGEYACLAASGALSVESVLELVSLRGRLMAEADPSGIGAMAAIVKLDLETVDTLVNTSLKDSGEFLRIANYNTPAQFVVSGHHVAVDHMVGLVKEHKGRGLMLKVSGAFHSPLMQEASVELAPSLKKAHWQKPRFAVYCNVHGKAVNDADSLRQCMVEQMTSSVQWIASMQNQWQDGIRHFLEVGPKAVLTKMVAPCLAPLTNEDIKTETLQNLEQIKAWS